MTLSDYPPPTFARTKLGGPLEHESEGLPDEEEGLGYLMRDERFELMKDKNKYLVRIKLYIDRIKLIKSGYLVDKIIPLVSKEVFASGEELVILFQKYNSKPELILDIPSSRLSNNLKEDTKDA